MLRNVLPLGEPPVDGLHHVKDAGGGGFQAVDVALQDADVLFQIADVAFDVNQAFIDAFDLGVEIGFDGSQL